MLLESLGVMKVRVLFRKQKLKQLQYIPLIIHHASTLGIAYRFILYEYEKVFVSPESGRAVVCFFHVLFSLN